MRGGLTVIFVKYFAEEPASFEALQPVPPAAWQTTDPAGHATDAYREAAFRAFLDRPRLFRGYLSATDLDGLRSGATGVDGPGAWAEPLVDVFPGLVWWAIGPHGIEPVPKPGSALLKAEHPLLVAASSPPSPETMRAAVAELGISGPEGRAALAALATSGHVVLWREPCFDGYDWSLLAGVPMADDVRRSFARHRVQGVRRFVIPLREARGEHRFHFERYDPEAFARHEVG